MSSFDKILGWLKYRRDSLTKFGVHSPFVFSFINRTLEDHQPEAAYRRVESVYQQWKHSKTMIHRNDLGSSGNTGERLTVGAIVSKQAVRRKYGRLLYRLAKAYGGSHILELGTSVGMGTAYLTAGNPESIITSIEGCSQTQGIAASHPSLQLNQQVRLMNLSFDESLRVLQKEKAQFDMVFIDGDHTREATLRYFEQLRPMLHQDSLLVFDDIHWSMGMEEAWAKIQSDPGVSLTLDLYQFGLVYFKKELSKQHIVLRF